MTKLLVAKFAPSRLAALPTDPIVFGDPGGVRGLLHVPTSRVESQFMISGDLDNATPVRCALTQMNAVFAQRIAETDLRLDRKSEILFRSRYSVEFLDPTRADHEFEARVTLPLREERELVWLRVNGESWQDEVQ